ncbi:MAG: hypothetical protein E5V72_01460 [Mesorhizobium sp.]|uniref:hypothetical protein n=1 Tax=Mesorhizobium sp. TaxID=1871066 RepID=UPI000FE5F24A|nr:hypothetical protein [Mesorhizobium sp.]RWH52266.1 MAG: hypothetical protein EOQ82_26580 [Mesorhizobium sp.]RWI69701.1 MAG: hypothetical protein EOR18_20955 [Mesorhizobium sp.]RWI76168.1 MAG: hypothetical protein EOR19_18545 [Mesorhizobium sp.]RWJ33238.1 MAG: hypothetical protein EOR28_11675 [Mesorhizobium sp.]TIQ74068.1 MAG: hypothetical protein E5X40_06775 [Mesorhizobium sp.]
MSLADAFAPVIAAQRAQVLAETWGHLAPKVREIYSGYILFTLGCHGDITLIDWEFKQPDGTELNSSPWFYEDINDFIGREIEKKGNRHGGIWRFDGTFERLKNGKSRWRGKTSPMRAVLRFPRRKP